MTHVRLRAAALAALPLTALAVLVPAGAASADAVTSDAVAAADAGTAAPAPLVPLYAGSSEAETLVAEDAGDPAITTAARATIRVSYTGFTPAAKASFQRAVDAWSRQISSPVPITVNARFADLGANVLGSAGPRIRANFGGAPQRNTWYPEAVANKRAGRQLSASADIEARFNRQFNNWHYGTGPAPKGTYDFQSVVMHELGHGLGFIGAGQVSGGRGTVLYRAAGVAFPYAYDRNTENAGGKKLLSFADPSAALGDQLTSGRLFFDSPKVRSANGGRPAKLYAPRSFNGGSSYSHLDESTYRAGNRNSLMTPQIGDGETVRTPGPLTSAIFRSTGW